MDCRRSRAFFAFAFSLLFGLSGVLLGVSTALGAPSNAAGSPPSPARLYVGIAVGGSWVTVIDPATNTALKSVKISGNTGDAIDLVLTPDGARLYTANSTGGNVSVMDTATDAVVATVGGLPGARAVAVSPEGARVYVVGSNVLRVINTATNTVATGSTTLGINPVSVAFNPSGTRAYVANGGSHSVSVIDTAGPAVLTTVPTGLSPHELTVSADGSRVYVAHNGSQAVVEIDTSTNTVVSTVPVGGPALGVAVNPTGTRVYAATTPSTGGRLQVIDTTSHTVVASVPLSAPSLPSQQAREVALNAAGTLAYVANNQPTGTVSVVDTATNTLAATIQLAGAAAPLAIKHGGSAATPPTAPGRPTLASGSVSPNRGSFGLTWTASTDTENDLITYLLEHKEGSASIFSQIATGLTTNAYAFTASAAEAEGTWTYRVRASDGSLSSDFSPVSDPIVVDKTPPTTQAAPSLQPNGGGWNKTDVTVTLSATDILSGVATTEYSLDAGAWTTYTAPMPIPISAEGSHTLQFRSTDKAGNVEPEKSLTVKIDKTRPAIGSTCNPGAPDEQWHAADVSFACTASDPDPGSGLANAADASFSLATTVAGSTETSTAATNSREVCDKAENCVTVGPINGNKVDKKAPMISITAPANNAAYMLGQVVTAAYTCSDGGSGPGTCASPVPNGSNIDTAMMGTRTLTVNATDTVGNPSSQSVTYTVVYNFTGFFQPVDNLPTLNSMQAGRSVPVKFSLGGNLGLNVIEAGYPRSEAIPCNSTALVDGVEETGTAGASSLTYDATTGQYHYVWKTEKVWAGTCRQLVVKLDDGTFHRANFQFK